MTIDGGYVLDAHVRIGAGREVELGVGALLAGMDSTGVDTALISPAERYIAWDNDEGNELTTRAAAASGGRLLPYAVANPWRRDAIAVLRRAYDDGAVALAVDAVLQVFDLHDRLVDPLLDFAAECGWPVYVRTGTPPTALPLPLASLARRHPAVTFIMGRSGATDFWIDAVPALCHAPNLLADTSYAPWDAVLSDFARHPDVGVDRVVFSTDLPYTIADAEIARVRDWPIPPAARARVFG
ncbi:MAG TPA: amidohydrolase family protein, partial [Pseudonocardiaceae bacterium]|nr:amidohydrolase family protein [Pseudonocardiaceae bacterium]